MVRRARSLHLLQQMKVPVLAQQNDLAIKAAGHAATLIPDDAEVMAPPLRGMASAVRTIGLALTNAEGASVVAKTSESSRGRYFWRHQRPLHWRACHP